MSTHRESTPVSRRKEARVRNVTNEYTRLTVAPRRLDNRPDSLSQRKAICNMNSQYSADEVQRILLASAITRFGEDRVESLLGTIKETAGAISRVLQEPLEATGDEPDPISIVDRRSDQ